MVPPTPNRMVWRVVEAPCKEKTEKQCTYCKHCRHRLEKDVVLWSAPPNGCRDTQHATWRIKNKRSFSVGIRWLGGRDLHSTRSIAQMLVGVVFNVSSHLYYFCCGSACMYASIFQECCGRPATPRLWSGFLLWLL
jgi:hypothetical protein